MVVSLRIGDLRFRSRRVKKNNFFNQKFHPLYIEALTNPEEFPSFYFLGLLKVLER